MTKRDKPPVPMAILQNGKLYPCTAYDAQELDGFPNGMIFDLIARNKRTLPLHHVYWKALSTAVDATGRWSSREALHTALKVKMGLVEPIYDLQGRVSGMQPHSTAFGAMNQTDFKLYFHKAMAELSDAVGYNVLGFLDQ